jgi:hypothetical protein
MSQAERCGVALMGGAIIQVGGRLGGIGAGNRKGAFRA